MTDPALILKFAYSLFIMPFTWIAAAVGALFGVLMLIYLVIEMVDRSTEGAK